MKTQLNPTILFASFIAIQAATANDTTDTSSSIKTIYGTDVKETLTEGQSLRVYLDDYAHLSYLTITGQNFRVWTNKRYDCVEKADTGLGQNQQISTPCIRVFLDENAYVSDSPLIRNAYARLEKTDLSLLSEGKHTTTLFEGIGFNINYNENGISVMQQGIDLDTVEVTITRDKTNKITLGYDEDPADVKPSTEFDTPITNTTLIMKSPLMIGKTVDGIDVALLVADTSTPAQAVIGLYTSKEDAINAYLPFRENHVLATEDGWQRVLYKKPVSIFEEANGISLFYVRVDFIDAHMPEVGGDVNGIFFMPNHMNLASDFIRLSKDYAISVLAGGVNSNTTAPETTTPETTTPETTVPNATSVQPIASRAKTVNNTSPSFSKGIYGTDINIILKPDQSIRVYLDDYAHLSYLTLTGQGFSAWLRSPYARIEQTELSTLAADKQTTVLFDGHTFNRYYDKNGVSIDQNGIYFDTVEVSVTREYTHKAALGYDEDPTDVKPSTEFDAQITSASLIMKAPSMIGNTVDGFDVALLIADDDTPAQAIVGLYTSEDSALNAHLPLREESVQTTTNGWRRALFKQPVLVSEEVKNNPEFYVRVDFENAFLPEVGGETNGTFFIPNDESLTKEPTVLLKDYGISLLTGGINLGATAP